MTSWLHKSRNRIHLGGGLLSISLILLLAMMMVPSAAPAKIRGGNPVLINVMVRLNATPGRPLDPKSDFQSITTPLKRAGRLFLIEATIGDQTGNFVFDTGASKLVLNRTYFRPGAGS